MVSVSSDMALNMCWYFGKRTGASTYSIIAMIYKYIFTYIYLVWDNILQHLTTSMMLMIIFCF